MGGQRLGGARWNVHTHITRSDYPRKARLSSRNWVWALLNVVLQNERNKESEAGGRNPQPIRR